MRLPRSSVRVYSGIDGSDSTATRVGCVAAYQEDSPSAKAVVAEALLSIGQGEPSPTSQLVQTSALICGKFAGNCFCGIWVTPPAFAPPFSAEPTPPSMIGVDGASCTSSS